MCLIGWAVRPNADYPLLLVANRDEYYDRPTDAAAWWVDSPDVFGGRDQQAGGTWLAAHRRGRLAAVTNYRDGIAGPGDRSRGELVSRALTSKKTISEMLDTLTAQADEFAGFNLLVLEWQSDGNAVTDLHSYYLNNRDDLGWRRLREGEYALSNGLLDDNWPKCERLSQTLRRADGQDPGHTRELLMHTMTDGAIELQPGQTLPDTGIGAQAEQELAPAFVHAGARSYGTRCTSLAALSHNGELDFEEWTWQNQPLAQLHQRRASRFMTGSTAAFATV